MTSKSRTVTISLSPALQARVNARVALKSVTRSEYLRSLIERDLDGEGASLLFEARLGFVELGIDALLKHHPNGELREVVHNTHRDRSNRRLGQELEA